MVRRSSSARRRGRTLGALLLTGGLLAALMPATAGAQPPPQESTPTVVANPGRVVLTVSGGTLSLGGLEVPLPDCDPAGRQCLSMTADLAADGTFRVPPGSLQLPAIEAALADLGVDLPGGLRVEAYTVGGVGGVFLPEGGLTRLDLGIGVRVVPDLATLPGGQFLGLLGGPSLSCGVGPVRMSFTTGTSGGLTGTPYDPATGALTLVDGAYVVPPVTCSPALLSLLQVLLRSSGGSLGGIDLADLLDDLDLGSLLGGLGQGGFSVPDLATLNLRDLLASLNASLGLPSAPGASGTSLNVVVSRLDGGGPITGGGMRWPALTFVDVSPGGEIADAVRWLFAQGITTGVGGDPTTFAPRGEVTRGQMAAFLWRMMGKPAAPAECGFTDVSPSAFYAPAVCWLKAEGITTGTNESGTLFSPNAPVSRSQMAQFLWRLAGQPDAPAPANFADVRASARFAAAVDWLRAYGITQGMGGGNRFVAGGTVTRSQMAAFLHRLASRVEAWGTGVALPSTIDVREGPADPPAEPTPDRRNVVGMGESEAIALLQAAGVPVRVAERDGVPLILTMDFIAMRVNLIVAGGVVTATWIG